MHIHNKQPTDLEVPISPEFKSLTPESFNGFLGELFNSSPEGVLIVDHARRPLLVNNKMVEFWDFPSGITTTSEALDLSIDKVEDPIVFRKRIEEIYADVHCESQEKIKLKNGRIYQRNTKPLLINGNHVGRFWTYRDITAEYQVEVALKESEAKYRVLYDNEQRLVQELALLNKVRAAIAQDLELPSLFQHVVESIAESFGFALVGLYLLKDKTLYLQHQVGYDQVISTIPMGLGVSSRVIQSGKPVLIEDTFNEPGFLSAIDGIVSEICVPLFDNEKVVGVLNVESINHIKLTNGDLQLMISLSEHINSAIGRARLFTEVKTQEKQLLSIFDLAPIGFLLCSIDGMFVQVNKAFENTLGYSSAELKKMKFTDITHPEDIDNNLRWVNRLIGGEITTYGFEKRYIHKNGSSINAFLQVSMLPTQENQPARLIAQVVNLTDLKKAESALLQHQKMEGISVFAGGIAHDFNNLLVTLKAQSSLALLKLPADSAAKKHIEKVKLAADSAAQLTEQLLAYTGQRQFKL
ncbi:MAG: PAS domain S-box-containing protein, partial [Cellvibrionaceae bacterium]